MNQESVPELVPEMVKEYARNEKKVIDLETQEKKRKTYRSERDFVIVEDFTSLKSK